MKKITGLIISISLLSGCLDSGSETPTDNVYQDFGNGRILALSGPQISLASLLDVNNDGFYDFQFLIKKTDGAFYISMEGITQYLQEDNPFFPVVQLNEDTPVMLAGNPVVWYMASMYSHGDEAAVTENFLNAALLSKDDDVGTIQPEGDFYIPVVMGHGSSKIHFGWIEILLDESSVQIKRSAFCTTPNKPLTMGNL